MAIPEGDHLYLAFPGATRGPVKVSYCDGGIVVCRPRSREYPVAWRKDGSSVDW